MRFRKHPAGVYRGRLVCDGLGNLLADEGKWRGYGVYHNTAAGTYEFVEPGGPSHNDRYGTAHAVMDATTPNDPHHLSPTADDPHYDPVVPSLTVLRFVPDADAPTFTGHTDAYTA